MTKRSWRVRKTFNTETGLATFDVVEGRGDDTVVLESMTVNVNEFPSNIQATAQAAGFGHKIGDATAGISDNTPAGGIAAMQATVAMLKEGNWNPPRAEGTGGPKTVINGDILVKAVAAAKRAAKMEWDAQVQGAALVADVERMRAAYKNPAVKAEYMKLKAKQDIAEGNTGNLADI